MIRSNGFVFSVAGQDLFKLSDGGDNDIQLEDVVYGNDYFLSPAEARELAEVLFQLAAEADPMVPAGEVPVGGDFHFADEPPQAVSFQPEETAQEKLKRILDAAAANRFDVI